MDCLIFVLVIHINIRYGSHDTVARLIRALTSLPVLPVDAILFPPSASGVVIFRSLFIGGDLRWSSFYRGHSRHPCIMRLDSHHSPAIQDLSQRFHQFREFILTSLVINGAGKDQEESQKPLHLTLIQRGGNNRVITNPELVVGLAQEFHLTMSVVDFSSLTFKNQITILQQTVSALFCAFRHLLQIFYHKYVHSYDAQDLLIAVGGTALHNVMFLHPGSSIIVLMPSAWCPWAWMYSNQAVLLDVHVEIFCHEVQK